MDLHHFLYGQYVALFLNSPISPNLIANQSNRTYKFCKALFMIKFSNLFNKLLRSDISEILWRKSSC